MSFKAFMDFAYPSRLHDNHATFDIKDMERSYNAGFTEGNYDVTVGSPVEDDDEIVIDNEV